VFYWVLWKNRSIVTILDVCIRCFTRWLCICDNSGVTSSSYSIAVKFERIWSAFNTSMTVGLGSRIYGSSSSISSSTCDVDKITSSQSSSKVSKVGMSSIIVSSSTFIHAALTRWKISFWSWAGRSSCFGFAISSFKHAFRKQFLMVEAATWSQLWKTQPTTLPTFTFFIALAKVVTSSWDKRNSKSILRYLTLKFRMIPESKGWVPAIVFGGRKTSLMLESSISGWQGVLLRIIRAFRFLIYILALNFWRYSKNIVQFHPRSRYLLCHSLE